VDCLGDAPADRFFFNRGTGLNSLREIGADLDAFMDWEEGEGFAHARGLFLRLARLRVCVPANRVGGAS